MFFTAGAQALAKWGDVTQHGAIQRAATFGGSNPRNPLHFDSIEGRRIRRENYLKYTTNYLQHP